MPKRGYFVHPAHVPEGCGVVAASATEAKSMVFASGVLDSADWIDLRCQWVRTAEVSVLPIGVILDPINGLHCGIIDCMEYGICDICGDVGVFVEAVERVAVCERCRD